jgi:hypothetical protein
MAEKNQSEKRGCKIGSYQYHTAGEPLEEVWKGKL